ncbi:mitochondrial small subunit ribosomal protein S5e [Pseudohyphozyma bogoriensis]|nr:mitochondrial small subunit ribosomal protein S5e [Pseudohyphozyma bogoriensis]
MSSTTLQRTATLLRQTARLSRPSPLRAIHSSAAWSSPPPASFESLVASTSSSSASSLPPSPSPSATPSTHALLHSSAPPIAAAPSSDAVLLQTLARLIMRDGKLARAHTTIATALDSLTLLTSSPPLPLLVRALDLVAPSIRIVGRRKGTKSLPTPQPLTQEQRTRQAWKWIVEASDKRHAVEKNFGKRLALEVVAVLSGQSEAIKKKEARHQQGVTGRANVGR